MRTIALDGFRIAYDDAGSGLPVVLIHGHPFNRTMWAGQIRALEATHRVIVPDLRGFGETTVTSGKVTLADHARDIATLLDALQVDEIILGGLSMGGQIVLEFYRQFSQRIRALVLASTFAQLDTPEGKQNRYLLADRLARDGMEGYAHEVLPKMVAASTIQEQPKIAKFVLHMMERTPPEGAAASLRGRAERQDYTPLLPAVTVPTLVVVGRDDAFTPVRDAERMRQAIPNAQLQVIDRAGHMPNLEQETAFNRILQAWLTVQQYEG